MFDVLRYPNNRKFGELILITCQKCYYNLNPTEIAYSYGICPECYADHRELQSWKEVGLSKKPSLFEVKPQKSINFEKINSLCYL